MPPFFDRFRHIVLLSVFILFAYAGSFMYPEAHWHHGFLGGTAYILVLAPFLVWLFYTPQRPAVIRFLSSATVLTVAFVVVGILSQHHFLGNQSLPDPGSSAKGLQSPARALLLHGHELYSVDAIGTPVSPGPGWILLWSPITMPGWTGWLTDIALAVAAWAIYRRNRLASGVFCVMLLVLPLFLRMMNSGMDLYAVSLAFVALGLWMDGASDSDGKLVLLALVGSVFATARIPMLLPVIVLGLGLYHKRRRAGLIFLPVLIVSTMAWHLTFAAIAHHAGHWYQPMHVLQRAGDSGNWNRVAAVVIGLACIVWCFKRLTADVRTWFVGTFLLMVALFTPTGISEGIRDWTFVWEGAGYICFPVPLLAAAIALYIRNGAEQGVTQNG